MSADDQEACDSCGFEGAELKTYTVGVLSDARPARFCQLCASTFAGNSATYPDAYKNGDLLRHVCHVGNAIIAEIRKARS